MIRRVHYENVRALRDVTIDFEPLTALVGPNASGKSTILETLLPGFKCSARTMWQWDMSLVQRVTVDFGNDNEWERSFSETYPNLQNNPPPKDYYQLLHLDPSAMRGEVEVRREERLSLEGSNLVNTFATLPRRTQVLVAEELRRRVPALRDVDVLPTQNGRHTLRFWDRWKDDVWYWPREVSDGTILMLGFLVLQHQPNAPDVVGIEEPERGLHPYLVHELIDFLRRVARGELGPKPIQVILATHSAELLDVLEPGEIRFLDRNPDGSVSVEAAPIEHPSFEKALEEYNRSLGDAWLSGGMGGVRGG